MWPASRHAQRVALLHKGFFRLQSTSSPKDAAVNLHATRSHTCGELSLGDVGRKVTLCGWLQYVRMDSFALLRDAYGSTQVIAEKCKDSLSQTPLESILMVEGEVKKRPEGQSNKNMPTGDVEVVAEKITVLNASSSQLPFSIRSHNKPNEALRMKYRYLDLRFPEMQRNLRLRSRLFNDMRQFLVDKREFVEVETPTLFRKTPGGAQEFIVPTQKRGKFFSLVQSPQQLKQLLMVGGIDRYFQIARCYRDETSRPDRQPEFTQMDIEMSFTDSEGVIGLTEGLLAACLPQFVEAKPPFPRISLSESVRLYGTDQPDLTISSKIQDLYTPSSDEDKTIRAVVIPTAAALLSNAERTLITKLVASFPSCKLLALKFPGSHWEKQLDKLTRHLDVDAVKKRLNVCDGDLVYVVESASYSECSKLLGKLRVDTVRELRKKNLTGPWDADCSKFRFVWIEDFPLFEEEDDGSLCSTHHPFTAPHPNDEQFLDTDPLKVRGLHYDLVLNGWEIGGGSVRIHDSSLQLRVIRDILKMDPSSMSHLTTALSSGAPPHAGIALGLDRLVSILVGAPSIRDVIAFPKTAEGHDPLSGAPSSVEAEDLRLYHVNIASESSVRSEDGASNARGENSPTNHSDLRVKGEI